MSTNPQESLDAARLWVIQREMGAQKNENSPAETETANSGDRWEIVFNGHSFSGRFDAAEERSFKQFLRLIEREAFLQVHNETDGNYRATGRVFRSETAQLYTLRDRMKAEGYEVPSRKKRKSNP